MSRTKKILLGGVGVLAALFVAALLLVDLDDVLESQKKRFLPKLEEKLGRKVTVAGVDTSVWGGISGKLEGIAIGPAADAPAGSPPWVQIAEVRVKVAFWPALFSLGRDVRVEEVVVRGLQLEVLRRADGTLAHDDVLRRLAGEEQPAKPSEPLGEQEKAYLRGLKIARIALEDAAIRVTDQATGGAPFTGTVDGLTLELLGLRGGQPLELKLRARVFAGAENLRLGVHTTPLPIDLITELQPGISDLTLWADRIDVARLTPYLGPLPVQLLSSTLSADLSATGLTLAPDAAGTFKGSLAITGLQFAGGQPFDVSVAPDVAFSAQGNEVSVRALKVDLAGMTASLVGEFSGLRQGAPTFRKLQLQLPGLDLGRLQTLVPPLAAALPPGTRLDGPLALQVSGDGDTRAQHVVVDLSLTPVTLLLPGALNKPAGVELALATTADYGPGLLRIEALRLAVGPLLVQGKGRVELLSRQADLTLSSNTFPLDGLVRLLPAVAAATPPDVHYAGQGQFSASVQGGGDRLQAKLDAQLSGAQVEAAGARLAGRAALSVNAAGNPEDLTLLATLDLDQADLLLPETLIKPVGTPAHVKLQAKRQGARVDIAQGELALGPLLATLAGSAALGAGSSDLRFEVARTDLAALSKLLPALAPLAGQGGSLAMKLHVAGDASSPATLQGELENLDLALGRSSLQAKATLSRLQPLAARFSLTSPELDLDQLLGLAPAGKDEPKSSGPAPQLPRDLELSGTLAVARGVLHAIPFTNLRGELDIRNGVVDLRTFEMQAFEGSISASGTRLDLSGPVPKFAARAELKKVSSAALLTSQTSLGDLVTGRLSGKVQAQGQGLDFDSFSKTLAGSLEGSITDGRVKTANLLGGIVQPLLAFLPGAARPTALRLGSAEGTPFSDLAGRSSISAGKLNLLEAMKLATPQGLIELTGAIGLDRTLGLKGTYHLTPATIEAMTGGKVKPAQALPVALLIGGTLLAPRIEGVDLASTGRALARDYLVGAAGAKAGELKDEAEQRARAAAESARAEAEKKGQQAAAAAQARLAEERRKAEEQAQKTAEQAKKKAKEEAEKARKRAEEEAKKRLHGLF